MIDGFDDIDDNKDAAHKDEHHGDDTESYNGMEAQEDVCSGLTWRDGIVAATRRVDTQCQSAMAWGRVA